MSIHFSQWNQSCAFYLSGASQNSSCRFAPKTAPKRGWNGSAPYSTLLYTWDKIRSEPWYAIPPNPTKHHCNARFFRFLITRRSQVQVLSPQPTGCGKKMSQPFFFVVTPKNGDFDVLFSRSYFIRLSNRYTAVGLFVAVFPQRCARIVEKMSAFVDKSQKDSVVFKKVFNPGCRFSTPIAGFLRFLKKKSESLQFVNDRERIDG